MSNQSPGDGCHGSSSGSSISSSSEDTVSGISDDDDEQTSQSSFCWGLCCVQGCVWGVLGGIYFFLLLPAGALLIVYGYNKEVVLPVILGILLICVSTCGLPAVYFLYKMWRRRQRKRRAAYRAQRNADAARVTFDNPMVIKDEETATS